MSKKGSIQSSDSEVVVVVIIVVIIGALVVVYEYTFYKQYLKKVI